MKVASIGPLGLAVACLALPASAQSTSDYCQGKSLTLVVGSPPGGGYDSYGRLVAEHFGKFIPGRCTIVVQNMPGAGSLVAANYLSQNAPKDGMTIGMVQPNLILNQAFNDENAKYDLRKFRWIGRIATSIETSVVWQTSPVHTIEDAKTQTVNLAAATANGLTAGFPRVLNAVIGTKFKIIPGYGGMAAIALALERGEVEAGHMTGSMLLGDHRAWLDDKKLSVLVQYSLVRNPELPTVPSMVELAETPEQKKILSLFAALTDIDRTVLAPPGVADERVASLRAAFAAMVAAPEFHADIEKRKMELDILPGEDVEKLIDSSLDISPSLAKTAEAAWTGKK